LSTPTILLVDDNQDSRAILSAVFAHSGYAVIEAPDGATALALARDRDVALVVCELYVPIGDTQYLVDVLKRQPETAELPVIVVTSRVMPVDRERARDAGSDAVLGKPLDLREILRLADRLIRATGPGGNPPALGEKPERTRSAELRAG
jgi:CheY-like chemotaxis protein